MRVDRFRQIGERMRRLFVRDTPPTVLLPPYPIDTRICPSCAQEVRVWRTYADGHIRCVACATADEAR